LHAHQQRGQTGGDILASQMAGLSVTQMGFNKLWVSNIQERICTYHSCLPYVPKLKHAPYFQKPAVLKEQLSFFTFLSYTDSNIQSFMLVLLAV